MLQVLHWQQKTEADKLAIDRFVPVPADLSRLSDEVKKMTSVKMLCMIN